MEKITVLEKGQKLEFSFEDLLKYHGVGYPGGVARQDFIEMARKPNRTEEEEVILAQMKRDMAKRLLEAKPEEVYDAVIV